MKVKYVCKACGEEISPVYSRWLVHAQKVHSKTPDIARLWVVGNIKKVQIKQ
jgi:hypothetical protein